VLKIGIVSVQPGMFGGFLSESMVGRAIRKGACEINIVDLRDFAHDKRRTVDDRPYGGGPGMLMICAPWFEAVETLTSAPAGSPPEGTRIIMTSPAGRRFTQRDAEELSQCRHIVFMCGHYEGFDARVNTLADDVFSIGDFVLTGGEIPAAAMVDSIVRLLPGVLGAGVAATNLESFSQDGMLEAAQYTHPPTFRDMKVPEVLMSGDHKKIEMWKKQSAYELTKKLRPDLLEKR
jgi:tRNA (guanine37-N1)-methyltransferase